MSIDKRRLAKRKALLGMNYGTARGRLERALIFDMAVKLGLDTCFRCGEKIQSVAELSVEHKTEWQSSETPIETYFDLENIAFSHTPCNSNAAQKRRNPHGVSKSRQCQCAPCIESRNAYNAQWMADWRANGKDKTRKNYQGPVLGTADPCKIGGRGA